MYKILLHPTDLSENHYYLCEKARQLADQLGAELHLLHVIEIPTSLQWAQSLGFAELEKPSKEGAEAVMLTLGEALNVPESNLHVDIGSVHDNILSKINALGCDLTLLGKHSGGTMNHILGSTVRNIILYAPCGVIVV